MGDARIAWRQRDAAIECCRKALAIEPDYAEARNNLGGAWREDGRLGEAEACYREAVRLKPDFVEARSNLGTSLYDLRLDEAYAAYLDALRLKSIGVDREDDAPFYPYGPIPALKPECAGVLSNLLMNMHYDARISNPRLNRGCAPLRRTLRRRSAGGCVCRARDGAGVGSVASDEAAMRRSPLRPGVGGRLPRHVAPLAVQSETRRFRRCHAGDA